MTKEPITGGCQCGAVRFAGDNFGRASICHCRMCQKAFGNFYAPLVKLHGLVWARGNVKTFASSNKVKRGFCADCGTPLTFDYGDGVEVAISALDKPEEATPSIQVNPADKLSYTDYLHELPVRGLSGEPDASAFIKGIINYQHPDHDTKDWKAEGTK